MTGKVLTLMTALSLSVLPSTAIAAEEIRKDNSLFVTLIFLGFCALIVVAQVLPAIRSAQRAAREERERRTQQVVPQSAPRD